MFFAEAIPWDTNDMRKIVSPLNTAKEGQLDVFFNHSNVAVLKGEQR